MEKSFPWSGVAPASGTDAGRFAAEEWWAAWMSLAASGGVLRDVAAPLRTLTTLADKGVFYCVPNQLEVTSSGDNTIDIDTGAGLVDGNFIYNDAAVELTVPSPAANPRIDRIVLRKNYTAATYTPVGSVDADEQVPALTTRITRLVGAENVAPVAPSLTQDATKATYWDVPLAQYQISVAGVISALTDERDYVDAETKYFFVPCYYARNVTDSSDIYANGPTPGGGGSLLFGPAIMLPDNKLTMSYGTTQVPSDYLTGLTVEGLIRTDAIIAGDIYGSLEYRAGACGEAYNTVNNGVPAYAAETINVNPLYNSCHFLESITGVTKDQMIEFRFFRDALDPLDTIGDEVPFMGFLLTYIGWR